MDFITLMFDQLLNHASKYRYMYAGSVKVPMVVRAPCGGGRGYGATHSQSLESYLYRIPGLKLFAPATCEDARGMLLSAIRDDNPVVFIEHKKLYGVREEVGDEIEPTPVGKARLAREGNDIALISYSYMVRHCLAAAQELQKNGVSALVLDLRSLSPLDDDAIAAAVEHTGRALVVEEGTRTGGIGAEISARISESCFFELEAPPARLATPDTPIPCSPPLENALLPNPAAITRAAMALMKD
ncbi:MAG: transketolase C-terminal domain-containing protein [Planctomycetota bacterium]|nr:transketolase C-terminal domain-containing protein [Planctomycetota bacterium]